MIVKHVDPVGGTGSGGEECLVERGTGAPPLLSPSSLPAPPRGNLIPGLAILCSFRSMGPTVMRVLTQTSASRAHIAFGVFLLFCFSLDFR